MCQLIRGGTAAGILKALSPNYVDADTVEVKDPGIGVAHVQVPSEPKWDGYLVKPQGMSAALSGQVDGKETVSCS